MLNRRIMKKLESLYNKSHLGGRLPVYDGRKSLYTAGPLPFISKEFSISLNDEDDEDRSGGQRFVSCYGFIHSFIDLLEGVIDCAIVCLHIGERRDTGS